MSLPRVLQLIAPAGVGGAESVVVAGAAALRVAGLEVTVGVLDERRVPAAAESFCARVEARHIALRRWPVRGRADVRAICALGADLRAEAWDIVHVHGYKAATFAALAAPRSCRLFATHHGSAGQGQVVGAYVAASVIAYRRAQAVFAVSSATADDLVLKGVQRGRVVVLPNFLSLVVDDVAPPPPGDVLRLVYVGRLAPEKGVDLLLRALAWSSSGATLDVIGDGPERARLEAMTAELQLGERVRFAGAVLDVRPALRAAHAAILPSRAEGLPLVLVEANALGRPVIAAAVGGVPEVIGACSANALVPAEDPSALGAAIDQLAAARDARVALAVACAPEIARRFSPAQWAERTRAVYCGAPP